MSRNTLVAAVAVILLVLVGWYVVKSKSTTPPETVQPNQTPTPSASVSPSSASEGAMMKEETMVKITSVGFSPQTITIKVGDKVAWTNGDSANHTVNSAPHPIHTAYPPLNLGTINPGEKKSLTFPKAGTYKYHDHLNPSLTGSVTVQ